MNTEIPTAFSQNGEYVLFSDIQRVFKHSPFGDTLLHSVRWRLNKPPEYSHTQWEGLLGVDANNFKHIPLTYGLTRAFLRYDNDPPMFIRQERVMLLLTATVHDWGEAAKGDVCALLKTAEGEDEEFQQLLSIARAIGINGSLYQAIQTSVNEVLHPAKPNKLSRAFHAIEVQGYHRTSLRAWDRLHPDVSDIDRDESLAGIIISVHSNHLPLLLGYAQTYPAIRVHLAHNAQKISTIFESFSDENIMQISKQFPQHLTPEAVVAQWYKAKNAWLESEKQNQQKL